MFSLKLLRRVSSLAGDPIIIPVPFFFFFSFFSFLPFPLKKFHLVEANDEFRGRNMRFLSKYDENHVYRRMF